MSRIISWIALLLVLALVGCGGSNAPPKPTAAATPSAAPNTGVTAQPGSDLASNLRKETGISKADRAANDRIAGRLPAPREENLRGVSCRTDFSGGVWSSRNGVRPTEWILHYTVSANRPGWSDVEAIENYFSNTRVGSSHFIVDFEGHCLKMVRGSDKAWTQGNANPWALSVEIIATGSESAAQWKASPLFKRQILAKLSRGVMDSWRIPIRRVDPVGCVFPAGWSDHNHLECGNDHHDVNPHFPFKVFARQLKAVG